jgi:hypothetical protein
MAQFKIYVLYKLFFIYTKKVMLYNAARFDCSINLRSERMHGC